MTHSKGDILIVDDMPDNIRFLSSVLLEQGYVVRKALNGRMALTAVQALPPNLILLDINMPDMNGYEVCQQIKRNEQTRTVPVIFLSALDSVADKVKAFQVGGVDYITKPFQFEEVLARIETQLTLCHLQTQLQEKNEALQTALSDLKQAQMRLIQQEKMIGLGQLLAGIAHEINNPISFISGNLAPAREYLQTLVNLIQRYQQEYPQPSPSLQAAIEETDLEFLVPDLQKLMNSMQVGVDRIRKIMLACRIFARLDESAIKQVNLEEGIESTLQLLQHRLRQTEHRPEIQVIKHYAGLPCVTCYASQLNQVFLNLLTNAIDALEDPNSAWRTPNRNPGPHPSIWIQTTVIPDQGVRISIKDNGPGIPEAARSRIFEPFYTTKPVGSGKGLGLAIGYEIVVGKHKGQLTCHTTPGEGTEFILEIPLTVAKA